MRKRENEQTPPPPTTLLSSCALSLSLSPFCSFIPPSAPFAETPPLLAVAERVWERKLHKHHSNTHPPLETCRSFLPRVWNCGRRYSNKLKGNGQSKKNNKKKHSVCSCARARNPSRVGLAVQTFFPSRLQLSLSLSLSLSRGSTNESAGREKLRKSLVDLLNTSLCSFSGDWGKIVPLQKVGLLS